MFVVGVNSGVSGTDAAGDAPPGTGGNRGGSSAYTAGESKDVSVCLAFAEDDAGAETSSRGMVATFWGHQLNLSADGKLFTVGSRRQTKDVVARQAPLIYGKSRACCSRGRSWSARK